MGFSEYRSRPAVVGHRGAAGLEPENTLRSLRRAIELGVDAVEVDVRLTRDRHLVIMHDETVDRTTNGTGRVDEMTLEEIRALDAGMGERVPTLEEVLSFVKGRVFLYVELKVPEAAGPAARLVDSYGMLDDVLFISFLDEALASCASAAPGCHRGLIYFKPPGRILEAKRMGAEAVLPYYRLATEKAVAFAKRLRLHVTAWTIDDPALAEKLWARGVDAVATNRPDLIVPVRPQA